MSSFSVQILIRLKTGVLDVQGKTVENSVHSSYPDLQVDNVRVGKLVEMNVEASSKEEAKEKAQVLCERILANPVIESYEIKTL
jgi:phosphoribosylformylglycinamidine synthase subunit PurS